MSPKSLINTLAVQGFQLRSKGENLELTGPIHRLTPELRQAIRDGKPALLQVVPKSNQAAERHAIQNQADCPPEGSNWPEAFTFESVREAVTKGVAPWGWEFIDDPLPTLPTVVNIQNCPEGWQDEEEYVYIGRANKTRGLPKSMFQNPFPIPRGVDKAEGLKQAVEKYRERFERNTVLKAQAKAWLPGKKLVCCCHPLPCHGDVIVEFLAGAFGLPYNRRDAAEVTLRDVSN